MFPGDAPEPNGQCHVEVRNSSAARTQRLFCCVAFAPFRTQPQGRRTNPNTGSPCRYMHTMTWCAWSTKTFVPKVAKKPELVPQGCSSSRGVLRLCVCLCARPFATRHPTALTQTALPAGTIGKFLAALLLIGGSINIRSIVSCARRAKGRANCPANNNGPWDPFFLPASREKPRKTLTKMPRMAE